MVLNLVLSAGFAAVAFLYGVVGHAGASGYIALMALGGLAPETIKPVALILNIVVASIGCWNFLRAGHLPWRMIWPVYVLAIPAPSHWVDAGLQGPCSQRPTSRP